MIKIFRTLEIGEITTVGADIGEGVSYCAAVALSQKYKDTPLTFHSRIESSQFGYELYNIGLYIKKKTGDFPLLAIERNIGQATIAKVKDLEYPGHKLYKQKTFDRVMNKEEERIGWVTTSANRRKMLDELAMDIRKKELKIYDEDILSEMLTFVINERTNEPRPESGRFSDLIMALAICNQIVKSTGNQAKWAPQQNLRPEDKRRLPNIAEGFIVEHPSDRKQDWRTA